MSRSAIAMMLFGLVVTLGAAPRVSLTPRLRSEPSGQSEGPDGRATAPAHRTRVEHRLNDPVRWPAGLRTAQAETAAIVPALAQLRRDCPELPSIPVRVLTSGEKSKSAQRASEGWKTTAARSPHAQYTNSPSSSHHMPIDYPDVVADAILSVLDSYREIANNKKHFGG